jgi:hypothetical protein
MKCRGIPHYKLIDRSKAVIDAQASKTDVLNTFQLKNLSFSLQHSVSSILKALWIMVANVGNSLEVENFEAQFH